MTEGTLDWVRPRVEELSALLAQPETLQDLEKWRELTREYDRLRPLAAALSRLEELERQEAEARELLSEPEMAEEAERELEAIAAEHDAVSGELEQRLREGAAKAPTSLMLEIRSGAGGEEAALFAAMLLRMYMRYAERQGYTWELMDESPTELGGVKDAVLRVSGPDAYERLGQESGVHRIQRIPVTESNGKRQTSTATVAVMLEPTETQVQIRPEDIRVDVYRASGHGGQYINKTDSAVRITHLPTGIVATCQDEKSQHKNREKAMRVLRARIFDRLQSDADKRQAEDRKRQVGTGDRSERIRTYNFNDGRVTDHRIGKTIYAVDAFVDGDMDDIIDLLVQQSGVDRLNEAAESLREAKA